MEYYYIFLWVRLHIILSLCNLSICRISLPDGNKEIKFFPKFWIQYNMAKYELWALYSLCGVEIHMQVNLLLCLVTTWKYNSINTIFYNYNDNITDLQLIC